MGDMVEVMVDTAMVDTVAREKLNHTMDMEAMVDTDTVDTEAMVDTVAREKLKLPQLHTMVDTEVMVDTAMVDTVESVKLKLPHTMDMVAMVDTVMVDTEDTLTASKRSSTLYQDLSQHLSTSSHSIRSMITCLHVTKNNL